MKKRMKNPRKIPHIYRMTFLFKLFVAGIIILVVLKFIR